MSTRKRLIIILSAVAALVVVSAIFLNYSITSKINSLLDEHLKQCKKESDYLFITNGGRIQSYVYENSFWDDFYNATLKKDTGWINENMTSSLQQTKYGSEFIWILDKNCKDIYSASITNNFEPKNLQSVPFDLKDSIQAKRFLHCIIPINGDYVEIYCAPTQLSADVKRISKPAGYLICGRRLNSFYFNELHKTNTQIDYSISPKEENHTERISLSEASIIYFKTIPFYNNQKLFIKAHVYQPEIAAYQKFVFLAFLVFISITLGSLVIFFISFKSEIVSPLSKISSALLHKDSVIIQPLSLTKNEFGEVARLIKSFFEANHKLEEEIVQRKASEEALQKALKIKSEFLSNMSHEIRTPINGIIGISNLLLNEQLNNQQMDYVKVLHHSSNNLLSVVSDILDVSKLESENFKFEQKPFNLHDGCEKVYQLFKPKADEKGLNFIFLPDSTSHSEMISGDEFRLGQILNNLISNAIKFTKIGVVEFSYKTINSTPTKATYEFLIKDSGIGIAEEDLPNVFESFSQANTTINRKFGGTGLGLSICKKLIEKQGGEIKVKSAYKVGSSFSFTLTFEKHEEMVEVATPAQKVTNQNLSKMKILIAEDNNINVFVLNQFLKKWGADVHVVENGKLALERLQVDHFDIVLMDYHMPVMNGLEATSEIRKSEDDITRNTPVFALTADVTSGTKQMLLNNGFNQYVSKPFAPEELYELLFKYKNAQ
ncbi:MAG: hypothetical protein RL708_1623 [Bacteroidota bacterium]|jgi:signal transduction histidine kinase/ActR/RegA family two-component response regulator